MSARIESLIVEGAIGTPEDHVNIWCNGTLRYLECQDLYANVDTIHYGGGSSVWELYVESSDSSRGNFAGTLRTLYVSKDSDPANGAFVVSGDLTAKVDVVQSFREDITIGGVMNALEPFTIGRNLHADCFLFFEDPDGLPGQVIINADNSGYVWDGVVQFAGSPEPLNPVPYYNEKSAEIGGGAVGLVPYYCHYYDCSPTTTKVDEAANGLDGLDPCELGYHAKLKGLPNTPVDGPTIRHYGPIARVGTGKPFTVKEKAITDHSCNWTDVTSSFTIAMHPRRCQAGVRDQRPIHARQRLPHRAQGEQLRG